jgi:hypothetical protein
MIAGALGAYAVVGGPGIERALAAVAPAAELSAARSATYTAVVEAVALAKASAVTAANPVATAARFAAIYRHGDPQFRTGVDNVLDRIAVPANGFEQMEPRARLGQLRRWLSGADPGLVRGMSWGVIAPAAIGFASLPFHQHTPDDPPIPVGI